jgi:hypothetical protein
MIATVAQLLGNMDSTDPNYVRIPFHLTNGLTMVVRMAVTHEKAARDQMNLFPELETSWTSGGSVATIPITAAGSGFTSAPTVTIGAPTQTGGVQARAVATIAGGIVTAITITEPGYGYTAAPTVTITGGGGSGATATSTITGTGVTVAGVSEVSLPPNHIAIYDVASYDDATIGVSMTKNRLEPMAKITVRQLASQDKSEVGYPRRFCYKSSGTKFQLLVNPLPTADFPSFVEMFGWHKDRDFTIVTDDVEPLIDRDWHNPACQLAAYLMAVELGWGSDAQTFYTAGETMIAQAIDKTSLMQQDDEPRVMLDGWFSRGHGRG